MTFNVRYSSHCKQFTRSPDTRGKYIACTSLIEYDIIVLIKAPFLNEDPGLTYNITAH